MQNDNGRRESILREEFEKALKGLKANKAPGVDLIAAELLQNSGQAEKNILFKLVCDMYETGDIPNDYKVNKTVTIPKKIKFGFRKEKGTREALLSFRSIHSVRLRIVEPTFIAFVDLEKVFNNVSCPKLFDISKNKGINYKDRKIISSLCRGGGEKQTSRKE